MVGWANIAKTNKDWFLKLPDANSIETLKINWKKVVGASNVNELESFFHEKLA